MELAQIENNILYFIEKIDKIIFKQSIAKRRISESKQKLNLLSQQQNGEYKENIKQKKMLA